MEFPVFETLCLENGKVKNLAFHQKRMQKTQAQLWQKTHFSKKFHRLFEELSQGHHLAPKGLYRLRIAYNAHDFVMQVFPYQRKKYTSFQLVNGDHLNYALKYSNRDALNALCLQKGKADEILIVKQGKITDCSIGNVVLRAGDKWFTPDTPLLEGTQRAYLLQQGKIFTRTIYVEDLAQFSEIRLINALNPLEENG